MPKRVRFKSWFKNFTPVTIIFPNLLLFFLITPLLSVFAIFVSLETIEDAYIKRIAVSALDKNLIYIGSKNGLFKSIDAGKTFEKIYVFKDEELMHIFFDPTVSNVCYIAATRSVYKVSDKIDKLFQAPEEAVILSIAKYKGDIYVGTSDGIYFASEDIFKWQKLGGLMSEISVYYIEPTDNGVYLATNKGIYFLKDKNNITRLFVFREKETQGEEQSGVVPNIIKVDIFDNNKVWLGTNKGLFASNDRARQWEKLYIENIDSINIYSLSQTRLEKNSIYIGSLKGLFKADLRNNTARQITEGIYSNEIFWVTFSDAGEIYLATPKGVFKNVYFANVSNIAKFNKVVEQEPTIREIQRAALFYNETQPEKIKQWRQALKFRALFPTVNLDYDKTISVYQSSTVDRAYIGPRDWGLSLSWDVADLIWNTHEDDIDTRSRLNTQLRLDILDEINRVYFERLRLKKEIVCSQFPEEELTQKDLRLQELTAIIDGYTGGYFSKRAQELKNSRNAENTE